MKHILVLLTALTLAACSSNAVKAPYAGENEGLVIFAADIEVRGDTELEYDFMFTVENLASGEQQRVRMPVEENRTYAVMGRLAPGEYQFVKREDVRRDGRGIRLFDIDGEFSVEAGHVTLPKQVMVEKKLFTRKVEITDLDSDAAEVLFLTDILTDDTYEGWSLLRPAE
ncbi:hypothetical protein [Saccharospirillum impatiens]|uniref:hypothetical protein n=1 Tax=Saccharospirillum impatiens TaxID=169438 RepID=UPI00041E5887|nr:hypothetical protein [Saccharospirillum impatiens]